MTAPPIPPIEIPLSKGWRFSLDTLDNGETAGWQSRRHDDSGWRRVCVPHTWNVVDEYAAHEGIAWYRLTFPIPSQADQTQVRLRFEAVFYLARVWLNEEYVGEHEGGYTPFEFDVGPWTQPGAENVLAVRVDNRRATNRLPAHLFEGHSYGWNNYGGIVRDVKLLITSPVYIDSVRVSARPHIMSWDQADLASVSMRISIRNASGEVFSGQVTQDILEEATGRIVAAAGRSVEVPAQTSIPISLQTSFQDPLLWHFDHPHLYRCVSTLKDAAGAEHHHQVTTFGVREVDWSEAQLRLNGEPVRLVGLSRHADVPGHGLAESTSVMTADFDDLKNLNMVFGRPVHYPQHEYVYDYCDRKGVLLCPELPAWQLTAGQLADENMRALARQQLAEMIASSANHPCIWAWSIGNEFESDTVAGRAFVREMAEFAKSLDPTRPVSFASYHLLGGRPWADATDHADFVMMNEYFGTWHGPKDSLGPTLDVIHTAWPDKVLIVSEFGFSPHWQRIEGPRTIDPKQYYLLPEDVPIDSPEADAQRQRLIREQMAAFRSKPFVSAAVFWVYRGGMGAVTVDGRRRPCWQTLREEFAPIAIGDAVFSYPDQDRCRVTVSLLTRGPVQEDLPAYTLRNYHLTWETISADGDRPGPSGEVGLPVLPPGAKHRVNVEVARPVQGCHLRVSVIRPNGFTVIYRLFAYP